MILAARSPSLQLIASSAGHGYASLITCRSPSSSPPSFVAPVFFRLTLHRRRRRVLDLEPVIDLSRPVIRAQPPPSLIMTGIS